MWSAAVAILAGAAAWWAKAAPRAVSVTARFRPGRAFAGEPVILRVSITNAKRLPVPFVRVSVWLPAGLRPDDPERATSIRGFQRRVFLPGGSSLTLDLPVLPRRRGEYWVERIKLDLADPFGLAPVLQDLVPEADLLVLPEPRVAVPIKERRRLPFGMPAPSARMYEDRERFAGVRAYEAGDPLNRIHWSLTGHTGKLQIKLFEPTRTAHVQLALDLAAGEPFWDMVYPEIAEDVIGWASFLARQAMQAGCRVGMVANTHLTKGRGPIRVPSSIRVGQEAALFAALARMPNEPTSDLAPVLRITGRAIGRDATVVVLSARPGPWLRQEMEVMQRRGAALVHLSPLGAT
jgi:uncharacterized protein (DUF58 family)